MIIKTHRPNQALRITHDNTGVLNADPDDAIGKRDTVGVDIPLRFSIKSSRLLERVDEREKEGGDIEGPSPRMEWRHPMRGEMLEEVDRFSSMSDAECVRDRLSPSPPTKEEGEGGCWSSVEPGPVKKQNLQQVNGSGKEGKGKATHLSKNCL